MPRKRKPSPQPKPIPTLMESFRKTLVALGTSSTETLEKFHKMFEKMSESPDFLDTIEGFSAKEKGMARRICGLPLRELPKLPFGLARPPIELVFRGANVIDIINFALVSRNSRLLMEQVSKPIEEFEVKAMHEGFYIYFTEGSGENSKKSQVQIIKYPRGGLEEGVKNNTVRRFGGWEFAYKRYDWSQFLEFRCENEQIAERLAQEFCRFALKAFKPEKLIFVAHLLKKNFVSYFIENIASDFNEFEVRLTTPFLSRAKHWEFELDHLTNDELRVLFEEITVKDKFVLAMNNRFEYDRPFRHSHMWLYDLNCKLVNVLTMNCEHLKLYRVKFSLNDLIEFMNHWKNGGLSQLKSVYLSFEKDKHDWGNVLPVSKWHIPLEKQHEKTYYFRRNNCQLVFVYALYPNTLEFRAT